MSKIWIPIVYHNKVFDLRVFYTIYLFIFIYWARIKKNTFDRWFLEMRDQCKVERVYSFRQKIFGRKRKNYLFIYLLTKKRKRARSSRVARGVKKLA